MRPEGILKRTPDDFVVDELPLYEPSGQGEHLYVRFEKRGRTTDDVVRAFAKGLGADVRDVGVPGMKDKIAVTTQTISIPPVRGTSRDAMLARLGALSLDGVRVLDAKFHGNKLRTGHLAGNRFTIHVRSIAPEAVAGVVATFERIGREGCPNAYGHQRFGMHGNNADRAKSWLLGEWPGPKDPKKQRFLFSALQSAMFNDVLNARVDDGSFRVPRLGDLLEKHQTGGLFPCTDPETDRVRAEAFEISPTGPMFGVSMRWPEGETADLERSVLSRWIGNEEVLSRVRRLGEGTRRLLRIQVSGLEVAPTEPSGGDIRLQFVLPKGAYATTVLSEALTLVEPKAPSDDDGKQDSPE